MSARVFLPSLAGMVLAFMPIHPCAADLNARVAPAAIASAGGPSAPLGAAVRQHAAPLSRLDSDAAALALYRSKLARALALEDTTRLLQPTRARRHRPGRIPPPDLREPALDLVRGLARWSTALALQAAAEGGEVSALAAIEQRERTHWAWLMDSSESPSLERAVRIAAVIAAFHETTASDAAATSDDLDLAASLDHAYPSLVTGPESWLSLAEQDGAVGIRERMLEHGRGDGPAAPSQTAMHSYFHSRLKPVFLAQVAASALLAEAEAERRAGELWRHLHAWREQWSVARGRARLCGTWSWTVHNHQNHQDHKMVVTFPPPDVTPQGPELPKTIVVLADAVYLRWEFPGGYQEDSLLFSGKDRRLEGTFVNSLGPYGSITGRKVADCSAER